MARNTYGRVIFNAGDLVSLPGDPLFNSKDELGELFVVIKKSYSEKSFSERLKVLDSKGKVREYPLAWFREVDEDVPSKGQ